jgi:hypothetical protein
MLVAALRSEESSARLGLVGPFLDRLQHHPKPLAGADFEVIRLIVSDDRTRAENLARLPTWRFGPDAAELARPLARRLLAGDVRRDRETVRAAAHVIAFMPAGTMAAAAEDLDAVARDPERRGLAWKSLSRLADSGPASLPRLIEIFARAADEIPPHSSGEREPLLDAAFGAAQGLCRLGPAAAAAARTPALAILRREIARKSPSWNLPNVTIRLLAHLGFASDIEEAFKDAGGVPKHIAQEIAMTAREPADRPCQLGLM